MKRLRAYIRRLTRLSRRALPVSIASGLRATTKTLPSP